MSVATVSLRLAVLSGFWCRFGPKKKPGFGAQNAQFWEGATAEFLAENLDLARPPPREYDG